MLISVFLSPQNIINDAFDFDFFKDFESSYEDVNYKFISNRESIYTDIWDDNYLISKDDNALNFLFQSHWTLLTSFFNPFNVYNLQFPWMTIVQHWIWQVFIDTSTQADRYFVAPLNSIVELTFTSMENDRNYNTIFLFPWQYIIFNPNRNSFYANADIARMQQLTEIGYISYFQKSDTRLIDFIGDNTNYQKYTEVLKTKNTRYQSIINQLQWMDFDFYKWFNPFERYFWLFINPEKKKLFYQNKVLDLYMSILVWNEFNSGKINEAKNNLEILRSFNQEGYDILREKILFYNSIMFRDTNPQNIPIRTSLASLEVNDSSYSTEFLSWVFYTYNTSSVEYSDIYMTILTKNYIDLIFDNYRAYPSAHQYFSLLLQEKLLEVLRNPEGFSNDYIILYLSEYLRFATMSFTSSNQEKKSLLYIYEDVIDLLEQYMRSEFFQQERSTNDLLLLNPRNSISLSDYQDLRMNIINILSFYTENDNLLSSVILRDVQLREIFREKSRLLREYLSALENYESYTLQYDSVSRDLLRFGREWEQNQVTEQDIVQYLSQFHGFWLANISIEIDEDWDARVERVGLSWRVLSFTLSPGNWNRLREIVIDGQRLNFEYPLDSIKLNYDEQIKTVPQHEKDRYDFSKFFVNTFINQPQVIEQEEFQERDIVIQEDRVIWVFKRETLLSDDGEFSWIKNVQFTFNNVIVSRKDSGFDIWFDDVSLQIHTPEVRSDNILNGFFTWKYIMTDTDGIFEKIQIQIYVDLQRSERTVFWNNRLNILWQIPRDDFNLFLENLGGQIRDFITVYNLLESSLWVQDMSLSYNPQNTTFTIRFDFSWQRNTIVLTDGFIQSYLRGWERIITNPISVLNLDRYLPN